MRSSWTQGAAETVKVSIFLKCCFVRQSALLIFRWCEHLISSILKFIAMNNGNVMYAPQ